MRHFAESGIYNEVSYLGVDKFDQQFISYVQVNKIVENSLGWANNLFSTDRREL